MLDEEMDGLAREPRGKLETIEEELVEVRRRLDRIWHVIETSDYRQRDRAEIGLDPKLRNTVPSGGGEGTRTPGLLDATEAL